MSTVSALLVLPPMTLPTEWSWADVRLVWYIDPEARTATVHMLDGRSQTHDENAVLDGGDVLPGFSFVLRDLLDRFPRE
jgi:hypothetical protein